MNMPALNNKNIFATLLTALLTLYATCAAAALKVGDAFPDLAAQKLEGKLPDSLKGKVLLVDFWASWCPPCVQSFPTMEELHRRFKDRGLVIIAVSVDEKATAVELFLKKHPASFSIVRDAEHRLVSAVDVSAMPTSFIVDAEGRVRFLHNGFHGDETKKQYIAEIESLLKGKP